MDAKRLEELAAWAKAQEASLIANDITDVAEYYADLARCAAAWANVERECCNLGLMPLQRQWQHINHSGRVKYGDTAIAAVEAAPEVEDAK